MVWVIRHTTEPKPVQKCTSVKVPIYHQCAILSNKMKNVESSVLVDLRKIKEWFAEAIGILFPNNPWLDFRPITWNNQHGNIGKEESTASPILSIMLIMFLCGAIVIIANKSTHKSKFYYTWLGITVMSWRK